MDIRSTPQNKMKVYNALHYMPKEFMHPLNHLIHVIFNCCSLSLVASHSFAY